MARGLVASALALAAVAETVAAADADPGLIDQLKTPAPWLKCGADVRMRNDTSTNPNLTDADPPGDSYSFERLRLREWNTLTAGPRAELNVRFTWEGRHYWSPKSKPTWDRWDVVIDALNAKFKAPQAPVTFTLGRQDIAFADGWMVSDGTPQDGPRTFYFDAARMTIEHDGNTLDLAAVDQSGRPDRWLPVLCGTKRPLMEQNERGLIAYLRRKAAGGGTTDAYFIYKRDHPLVATGDKGEVYTVGGRGVRVVARQLSLRCEAAYQFGRRANAAMFPRQGPGLSAWGLNSRLTYDLKDTAKQQLWAGCEYQSGQDAHHRANHQFDPLWSRWAQYSELFPNEFDRPSDRANLERANLGYQVEPRPGTVVQLNYNALFAAAPRRSGLSGYSTSGRFKGHLVTALVRRDWSRFWSGLLLVEYFQPGDYYAAVPDTPLRTRRDPATFVRGQVVFTF